MTEGHNEGIRVKPRHYDYLKFSLCSLTKPLEYGTISITLVRALWSFSGYMTKTDFLKHSIFESSRRLFESNCNAWILYFTRKAKTAQTNDLDISGVHGPLKDKTNTLEKKGIPHIRNWITGNFTLHLLLGVFFLFHPHRQEAQTVRNYTDTHGLQTSGRWTFSVTSSLWLFFFLQHSPNLSDFFISSTN